MSTLPWIISVDDHVVEPPTVWSDRLPARDRERGPHVVQDTCETVNDPRTLRVNYTKGGEGPVIDWWVYEDLVKVVPKVVACAGFPVEEHNTDPIAYRDMRPGCYDPVARLADMDSQPHRALAVLSRTSRASAARCSWNQRTKSLAQRCVIAYNDWMIEEWCGDSGGRLLPVCLIPLWDPASAAAEIRRNAARGCRAVTFPEMPHHLGLPSIHDPEWLLGSGLPGVRRDRHRACACTSAPARRWPRRARSRRAGPTPP